MATTRKMSTAQNEYALTQLGGVAEEGANGEAKADEGPAGFLQFCGDLDELPTPPPDLIRRDSSPPSPRTPSPRSLTPSETKQQRKSIFNFKKDKS